MSDTKGKESAGVLGDDSAFPYKCNLHVYPGLTKREWMATMALQGHLASDHDHVVNTDAIVAWSVQTADALLVELEKGGDNE